MSLEIIAVIGATGNQGSGVVANLLASTSFVVRAISSNVNGDKARALAVNHKAALDAGRLIMTEANLDDRESLEKAFDGSYGVFVAQAPGPTEVQQGRNIVDAAKVCDKLLMLGSSRLTPRSPADDRSSARGFFLAPGYQDCVEWQVCRCAV